MSQETMRFLDMARAAGLPKKAMYTVSEVAAATGVPRSTLADEVSDGRIATFTPPGRKRGRLIRPEWVDEWIERGTRKAVEW